MEALTAVRWSLGLNVARGAYEVLGALKLRDTWAYCGWQDIRLRYRRSILGPWWLTASTAVIRASMRAPGGHASRHSPG